MQHQPTHTSSLPPSPPSQAPYRHLTHTSELFSCSATSNVSIPCPSPCPPAFPMLHRMTAHIHCPGPVSPPALQPCLVAICFLSDSVTESQLTAKSRNPPQSICVTQRRPRQQTPITSPKGQTLCVCVCVCQLPTAAHCHQSPVTTPHPTFPAQLYNLLPAVINLAHL
ncbi:uncharacterized protein CCOS01_07387 [Colletotrichum costaricense]|uniref:Uncharacterized protein n=1 Tax=Colletotrichum costaricense TaxID=1209916 RepID=A0AAI9YXV3_9PEZI|nr:uncharacterized protein CCOS01_07387 [Colletotrichum costaricense]KAK1527125.1 hypothetical protein CCOS01_07387 [Colletotrichum costaricense]